MTNMIDKAIEALVEKEVKAAKQRLFDNIREEFKTNSNVGRFKPEGFMDLYTKKYL